MIHTHLIASKAPTTVYAEPTVESKPMAMVLKGNWLGEIDEKGDWIRVITIDTEGWVRKSDVEVVPPMSLHAIWRPGKPIAYMHLSNAS